MDMIIEQARQIVSRVEEGTARADEVAGVVKALAKSVQAQRAAITCIEFALEYYSVPDLYLAPVAPGRLILDGGLRARTALGMLKPGYRSDLSSNDSFGD